MFRIVTNFNILVLEHEYRKSSGSVSLEFVNPRRAKSHISPKWVVFLLCFCSVCCPSNATELIMMMSGNRGTVIFAADGVVSNGAGKPVRTRCKIRQTGDFFWAASGVTEHYSNGFDVARFVEKSARGENTVPRILDDAGRQILPSLQAEIPLIKRQVPWLYERIRTYGYILTLFAVRDSRIGIEAYFKEFRVANDRVSTAPAAVAGCDDPRLQCIRATNLSDNSEMIQYVSTHPEIYDADPLIAMDRLMAIAIKSDPVGIGPPVSVLQIAPHSVRWLRQNDCQDIVTEKHNEKKRPTQGEHKPAK